MTDQLGVYKDYLTESGQKIFKRALDESLQHKQNGISYGHILKALKAEEPILFDKVLSALNVGTSLTDEFLDKFIDSTNDYYSKEYPHLSPHVADICRQAMQVARADNRRKIESADLVLAIEQLVL